MNAIAPNSISPILQVAGLMELAAATAPKTKGENFVLTMTISGATLKELSRAMVEFGRQRQKADFDRDGSNVAQCAALVLVGIKSASTAGLDCGACGFANCSELKEAAKVDSEFLGPICAYRHIDLGIALGSAVKIAQLLNVDNRIMYRAGAAARWMKLVDWDLVMGIPLSATGKNLFFDRR